MSKTLKIADLKLSGLNRRTNLVHVKRLKDLIKENGYIKGMPILATEDGEIIDGQHRYLACLELGIEPEIAISPAVELIPIINATQLKWSTIDYMRYYAAKGYPDYIIMQTLCEKYAITPSLLLNIYYAKTTHRSGLTRPKGNMEASPIKSGNFKFEDSSEKGLAKFERKVKAILNLAAALELPRTDKLLVAITRIAQDSNFRFDKMLNKLEYMKSRVYRCATIGEYVSMLSFIYNYRNQNKINV